MTLFTKESLTEEITKIASQGWLQSHRDTSAGKRNDGAVGNFLEHLLGIEENNLPIPNASEWELKVQRKGTSSLLTLFHSEPSPKALKFVPRVFLPIYGWRHQQAGGKYDFSERSFRQTMSSHKRSDRGFMVLVDEEKIKVSFDYSAVDSRHSTWLEEVRERGGLNELDPMPYWGFSDLEALIASKINSTFYVTAEVKKIRGQEWFKYSKLQILRGISLDGFLSLLRQGKAYVDFDARSSKNHGTKFRIRKSEIPVLYQDQKVVFDFQ